jgi:hypothetical protein
MSGSDEHSSPGPSQNRRTPDRFSSDSFDRDVEVEDAKRALLEPSETEVETTLKPIGRGRRDSHSSGRRSIKRKSNVEFVREMLVEVSVLYILAHTLTTFIIPDTPYPCFKYHWAHHYR